MANASGKSTRMTKQRQVILEEVKALKTHPTADDVFVRVRNRLPRISLGTVYRNLDVLAETGQIKRVDACGSQYRFDGDTGDHYHIRCVRCGRLDDVRMGTFSIPEDQARELVDYDVVGHRFEFLGVCPECKAEPAGLGTDTRESLSA